MMEELQVDVAVVGGGPAGMSAALAAARGGVKVALIDEYAAPGGQIWRRRYDEVGAAAPPSLPRAARELCAALADSSVTVLSGASVWAAPSAHELLLTGPVERVRAGAVVMATGAYDRPLAFPGWTLPGVMTAGGAQALAKGQGIVPGRRVLLAGAGPFLLPVAAQLAASGAKVVAVAEATRRRDWARVAPRMSAHPDRLRDYLQYRTKVRRIEWGHVLVRASGSDRVETATIAPCGPDWAPTGRERTFEVDAVCTAYGFLPSVDLARALGCELRGDAVAHDDDMATTVGGVFVAGEASGIGGSDLAQVEGELAGSMAAAHVARHRNGNGHRTPVRLDLRGVRARRAKLASFAGILGDLFDPRPGLKTLAAPDTILCRCEDVTAGAVDAAVQAGATTMSALKIVTRCGQGPCQGRTCERLVAARLPEEPARFNARAPMRPVQLEVLIKTATDS